MTLSALIKKGGLTSAMTATHATTATHKTELPATVAAVATVAVSVEPEIPDLSQGEELRIRGWLSHIEENDPAIIAEVLDKCRNGMESRRYFLHRSDEVPEIHW